MKMSKKREFVKNAFTKNIGLKVFSIVLAALIWLVIVNISDPVKTVTISDIPIEIRDAYSLAKRNLVYDVTSKKTVKITVSGKRSVISDLSAEDFTASASLKEVSLVDSAPVEVKANKRSINNSITISSKSVNTVTVKVEKLKTITYPIEVKFVGEPEGGYVASANGMSFKEVKVEAPKSVHKKIGTIAAICDVDDAHKDFDKKCVIKALDKKGKELKVKHIYYDKDKVRVYVHMKQEKTVPVSVSTPGKPKKGYKVSSIKLSKEEVILVGEAEYLDKIERIDITDKINLSGKKDTITVEFDLNKYIPANITLLDEPKIAVTIEIKKKKKR